MLLKYISCHVLNNDYPKGMGSCLGGFDVTIHPLWFIRHEYDSSSLNTKEASVRSGAYPVDPVV